MVKTSAQYSESCTRCPRLVKQLKQLRVRFPDYWNKPVPAAGDPSSKLVIVGLAPGLHGANKTGVPFTGDASGHLLFKTMEILGIEKNVRITNVVKCLPVKNAPVLQELNQCRGYLTNELMASDEPSGKKCEQVLFALGRVAHESILKVYKFPLSSFRFEHGAIHRILPNVLVVDSYHCSRYNTQTGRLTEDMFHSALKSAARLAGLLQSAS